MSTTPNAIILTGGLSGSSVLAGLLVRAGLWPGDATAKVAYETWENIELVELNRRLLTAVGYDWENDSGPASVRPSSSFVTSRPRPI